MTDSIKARLAARRHDGEADRGDLVQTVLLIAGFAIAAILVVTWVSTAILNKGADAANCIEASNTYSGSSSASQEECDKKTSDTGNNSFKNDSGYKSRYS